jgi:serine-type D-Ala-D-Ala carboxypeptidase (penicillin-binding protein 5/6)
MMKFWLSYTTSMILIGIFAALVYWAAFPDSYKTLTYTSPLPDFLTLGKNNQVTGLDIWSPLFETFASTDKKPDVQAKAVLLYDLTENKVLFERNARQRMPMASLTKIMTAIVALEDPKMPSSYRVYGEDLVGEDSMGLEAGEILTKEELLYGLMLNSGNDASEVLAHNYSAGRSAFLTAMHDKAKALGLADTSFSNPSGLQGDGVQYTTAHDLLVMTRYALDTFQLFREIVATYEYEIPANNTHKVYYLTNETNLISTYPGVKGVKTGYTPEAGMCLITYYEKDGVKLVGILLNSPDRRGEMKMLLDYALTTYGMPLPEDI